MKISFYMESQKVCDKCVLYFTLIIQTYLDIGKTINIRKKLAPLKITNPIIFFNNQINRAKL